MAYIKLEQAAEMLGLTIEKLNEYRENYDIKGYKDGASWKFQEEEVERFAKKLGTDVSAVAESLSGVDLPTPSADAGLVDIDSDLDEMIDLGADSSEDTDGPDSVLVSEQALGESDAGASSTIIGEDKMPAADSGLNLELEDNESSEELVLDLDDDVPLLGEAADDGDALVLEDSGELKLDGGSELKLDDGSELKLDGGSELKLDGGSDLKLDEGSELKLDGGSELTLDAGSELKLDGGSDLDLSSEVSDLDLAGTSGSSLDLGIEEASGDSPTTGSGLELADADSSADGGIAGAAAAAAAAGTAAVAAVGGVLGGNDDDSGELLLQGDSGVLASGGDDAKQKIADAVADSDVIDISDDSIDLDGDDLVLEGGSALDLGGSSLNLEGSGTGIGLSGLSGLDSDVTINAGDSGISLTSPSDSGISLEDTPMELAGGSDIDALELGEADDDIIDLGDDAVEDLDANTIMDSDDFGLTPVEGLEDDDADSGSQVIALDTDELESEEVTELGDADFGGGLAGSDDLGVMDEGVEEVAPLGAGAGVAAAPEAGYSILTVVLLGMCALVLALGGMMITDLVRNMWSWNEPYALNSALMDMIIPK